LTDGKGRTVDFATPFCDDFNVGSTALFELAGKIQARPQGSDEALGRRSA
jgi:hypothetical protein